MVQSNSLLLIPFKRAACGILFKLALVGLTSGNLGGTTVVDVVQCVVFRYPPPKKKPRVVWCAEAMP